MSYGIPGTRVTAYTYEADYHCVEDTEKRFGVDEHGNSYGVDSEGNEIHAVFTSDGSIPNFEVCADCGWIICLTCGELNKSGNLWAGKCWNCGTTEQPEYDPDSTVNARG